MENEEVRMAAQPMGTPEHHAHEPEHDEPAHAFDQHEPNYAIVAGFSILSVIIFAVAVFAVWQYYEIYTENKIYERVLAPASEDLKAVREREDKTLHTYGSAAEAGKVRIPIDRAMELLVQDAKDNHLRYPTNNYTAVAPAATEASAPAGGGKGQGPGGSAPGSDGGLAAGQSGMTGTERK